MNDPPPVVDDPPPVTDDPPPPDDEEPEEEPLQVESTLPADGPGEAGVEYTFTFVYDEPALTNAAASKQLVQEGLAQAALSPQAAGDEVVFRWTFGDGVGTGNATVTVGPDGRAMYQVDYAYRNDGRYGLVLTVEDGHGELLAKRDFIIEIGDVRRIETHTLPCEEQWQGFTFDYGYGVTTFSWDISAWPTGSIIDFKYDAYTIPDKFIVMYPLESNTVVDTGWRGDSDYEGSPLFPGGIAGDGEGEILDIATKTEGYDYLYFTIIGPDENTSWEYWARCTPPPM